MSDSDSSYESVEEEEFAPAASAKSRAAPPPDPAARSGSGSPPRAASSGHRGRPETRSVAPVRRDVTESWSPAAKGKGKGKGWTQSFRHCPHCWQRTSTFSSAVQQHEYWNYICLRWQRYNRGGITWEEAGGAQRQKDRRERRHQQSMYSRALSAPAEYEMKEKKDRKRRQREKKRRTPSPVIKRERRRPPSNDSRDGCEPRIVRRRDGEYLMMKLKSK